MSLSVPDPSTVTTGFDGPKEPVLFDRYRILGILGQGGMGTVYRGFHINLKRPVAIKTLRIDRLERAGAAPRFMREMELAGQLDHRHIVRTTDGGESNGIYYLVMEYLEGRDLDQILRRLGSLSVADACELARQAAVGLAYAHEKLIHRDIKPSNLWLTPGGVVKILDLGLARCHELERVAGPDSEETPEGAIIGTYDFLSPEQAAGRDVDCRTDLYSLGCTLFKLMVGVTPYSGPGYNSPAEKLHAHLSVPLEKSPHFHDLPAEVVPVFERLMAKDPADRYATAQEAAQALAGLARTSQVASLLINQPPDQLQPLPLALPDDLSRLTVEPEHTRVNTDARPQSPARPRLWLFAATARVAAGLLLCLAGLAWMLGWGRTPGTPTPPVGISAPIASGPVRVDELLTFKFHPLLRQLPVPIGIREANHLRWRWDQDESLLDVKGPGRLFFPLGKTNRARWTFEVTMTQLPWTGECGIFWGLSRDDSVEKARTPDVPFAQFQFLVVTRTPRKNPDASDVISIRRGNGILSLDHAGEPLFERKVTGKHDLAKLPIGEKPLSISIEGTRLRHASFGAEDLTGLTRFDLHELHGNHPAVGEFGVFAINSTTFANARYKAASEE